MALLHEAAWHRCYVHFPRNALHHMPPVANDERVQELRWLSDRPNLA